MTKAKTKPTTRELARELCRQALGLKSPTPDTVVRAPIAAIYLVSEAINDLVVLQADMLAREASRPYQQAVLMVCLKCDTMAAGLMQDGAVPIVHCEVCDGRPPLVPMSGYPGPRAPLLDPKGQG